MVLLWPSLVPLPSPPRSYILPVSFLLFTFTFILSLIISLFFSISSYLTVPSPPFIGIKSSEEFVTQSKRLIRSLGIEQIVIDEEEDKRLVEEIEIGFNNFVDEVFGDKKPEESTSSEDSVSDSEPSKSSKEKDSDGKKGKALTFDEKIEQLKSVGQSIFKKFT